MVGAMKRALSAPQVTALKAEGTHWVAPGLYLQIKPNGARSWLLRYRKAGKTFWHGLGAARDVPLTEARQKAEDLRVDIRRNDAHPVAERRAARELVDGRDEHCAIVSVVRRTGDRGARAVPQIRIRPAAMAIFDARPRLPHIGDLPIDRVGLHEVHKVLTPIWQTQHPTAKKVRGRIATILDWAAAKGYREGMENPARPNGPLDQLLPPVRHREKHHASVPYAELPDVVARLIGMDSISAKAGPFTILTGVRSGETRGAVWTEIDLDTKTWTIPPERNKTADEYRIPLSEQAAALLKALPRSRSKLVFPSPASGKPLSDTALTKVLKAVQPEHHPSRIPRDSVDVGEGEDGLPGGGHRGGAQSSPARSGNRGICPDDVLRQEARPVPGLGGVVLQHWLTSRNRPPRSPQHRPWRRRVASQPRIDAIRTHGRDRGQRTDFARFPRWPDKPVPPDVALTVRLPEPRHVNTPPSRRPTPTLMI